MRRIQIEFTIDKGLRRGARKFQVAPCPSAQSYIGSDKETIEQFKGEVVQGGISFEAASVAVVVSTVARQHFFAV